MWREQFYLTPSPVPVGRLLGRLVSTVTFADTSAPLLRSPGVCDVGTTSISGAKEAEASAPADDLLLATSWLATTARVARRSSLALAPPAMRSFSLAASRMSIIFLGEVKLALLPAPAADGPLTRPNKS